MKKKNLLIVLSSQDKEVAEKFPLLYSSVALPRGYWKSIHLMFWGPSIKLLTKKSIQKKIKTIQATGVKMSACIVCVEDYDLKKEVKALNIKVNHTGELLTKALKKESYAVITL